MDSHLRAAQAHGASATSAFSLPEFFHEAYDKGIVIAVQERPAEAVITAAGAVAAVAAAVYVGRGALARGVLGGAEAEGGRLIAPAVLDCGASGAGNFSGMAAETSLGARSSRSVLDQVLAVGKPNLNAVEAGMTHVSFAPGATLEEKAASLMEAAGGKGFKPLQVDGASLKLGESGGTTSAFGSYKQAGYKFVPVRSLATSIRME